MDESRADTSDLRVCGEAILYRLFDVGYRDPAGSSRITPRRQRAGAVAPASR